MRLAVLAVLCTLCVQVRAQAPVDADAQAPVDRGPQTPPETDAAAPTDVTTQSPVDWDALYSSPPGEPTSVSISDLPEETLLRMLFVPGEIIIDGELSPAAEKVLSFRQRHPAIEFGRHEPIVNRSYTFRRRIDDPRRKDDVVVVFDAEGKTAVNVSRVFPDDALVQDAMTGRTAFVSFGMATFDAHPSGLILIEELP